MLATTVYITLPVGFGWVFPVLAILVFAMIVKFILRLTPIV